MTHVASEPEYWQKLQEKLREEAEEFLKNSTVEEFADILEVLDAIAEEKGFKNNEITAVKTKKAEERGRFKERIILDEA